MSLRRLGPPLLFSGLLIALAPFLSEIRDLLRNGLASRFVLALSMFFALAVAAQAGVAVLRIRERRLLRYGMLAIWAVMMALQLWVWSRPNAAVSAVERVHFVFYSVLAVLFFRSFRERRDLSGALLALLAGSTVGILDEGMQWLVPVRVADFSDVLLNSFSVLAGVFLAIALIGVPTEWRPRLDSGSVRGVAIAVGVFLAVLATYLQVAHLGHLVADPTIGSFRSLHTRDELLTLGRERAERWQRDPPGRPSDLTPLEVEDYYRSEAGWHVQQRNRFFSAGDFAQAAKEKALLETYFAPFLDLPNDEGRPFHFSPGELSELENGLASQGRELDSTWVSPVGRDPATIFLRPTSAELWLGLGLVLALLGWLAWRGPGKRGADSR